MIRDFSKIETFLTVVRERSFSKASKKLGISQPAVTQQIKLLEDYIDTKIVDRKKNGIRLTKEGEELHKITLKLERCLNSAEKEILKIINKEFTFVIGASFVIGNYILPDFLNDIKGAIKNEVMIKVDLSEKVIEDLLDKKIDLALIESPIFEDGIMYREWMDDEMVLVSNIPLPKFVKAEDLLTYNWVCREEDSMTRRLVSEAFEEIGVDCKSFNTVGVVTSSTAVLQTLLKAPTNSQTPTVSVISKHVIQDSVIGGKLYTSKIRGFKLIRKLYIAHLKDRKHDAFVDNVVNYIMSKKKS